MTAVAVDYVQLVEEVRSVALEYTREEWPVFKKSKDVEISSHSIPGNKCKVYKAVGELDVPPTELYRHATFFPGDSTHSTKRNIHSAVKLWEVVRELSETVYIQRTVSKALGGGLISAREYIDIVGMFSEDNMHMVVGTGVDYPYPTDDKCIQAWNHLFGLLYYPVTGQPHKTKLVYLLQTDLKGKLPTRIAESALPDMQLSYYSNLRKAIREGLNCKT